MGRPRQPRHAAASTVGTAAPAASGATSPSGATRSTGSGAASTKSGPTSSSSRPLPTSRGPTACPSAASSSRTYRTAAAGSPLPRWSTASKPATPSSPAAWRSASRRATASSTRSSPDDGDSCDRRPEERHHGRTDRRLHHLPGRLRVGARDGRGGGASKAPSTSAGSTSNPRPRCSWVRTRTG